MLRWERIREKVGPSKQFAELVLKDIEVKIISPDLEGYEFEITCASDKAGFTAMKDVEGTGLKKVLLTYAKGMEKRPKRERNKKH